MKYTILLILAVCISGCKLRKETQTQPPDPISEPQKVSEISAPDTLREMVFFKGGKIKIGSQNFPNESPAFDTIIKPFYIDKYLVTVKQFRDFVFATGFKTEAENYGDAGVYDIKTSRWNLLPGATWMNPMGPGQPPAHDNYPVTQVSWNDAVAYCKWAGLRLPTEYEWEFAARNGENTSDPYSWGTNLVVNGRYNANVWEGEQTAVQGGDGFVYTSPVGHYGFTKSGLSDMGGNVWQWCSDTYTLYQGSNEPFSFNPEVKAIRGGSFFFDEAKDKSYTVSFRGQNTVETSLFNLGFRCARDGE